MAFQDQWTEEEDDFLRRTAEQGQSAGAAAALLADIFGISRSRSAVIGRANRKGILFRGQIEYAARQTAEAAERRKAKQTAAPKAETKIVAANLMRRRAQLQVEHARNQPAEAAAEIGAVGASAAATPGDNSGVLFISERTSLQCAWPLDGWDALPVAEKRVCGKPVLFRAGPYGAAPTAWCRDCRPLAYRAVQGRRLDVKFLSRLDKSVRAA